MNLIVFNKPYKVLSQFTDRSSEGPAERATLAAYLADLPGYYPAGRLDYDSEGLLLLTNSGELQHRIAHPDLKMEKRYWVQVEGQPAPDAIQALRRGIQLRDGPTRPARVQAIEPPTTLWPREPAVAPHRDAQSSWFCISIREGRNRQVRRMFAAIDSPVLRLIRFAIGPWQLDELQPGESRSEQVNLPQSPAGAKRRARSSAPNSTRPGGKRKKPRRPE